MFEKIWKKRIPKTLPILCSGWNHGLIDIGNKVRHGAFVRIYHLYPEGNYCIKPLWAFSDETIYLQLQWMEECKTIERLLELLANETILAFPPNGSRVVEILRVVYNVMDVDSRVSQDDLILEIKDVCKQLRNEPDSLFVCRSAVRKYCLNPTKENLLLLKESYFSMPRQTRPALISMDAKDHLVRNLFEARNEEELQTLTLKLTQEVDYSWGKSFS